MIITTIAAMLMNTSSIEDDTVVCLSNMTEETMIAFVAEKYMSGAKKVRQVAIKGGKKSCMRYDRARTVTVKPYLLAEAQRRVADGDFIDPWRSGSCARVSRGDAAFYELSGNDDERGSCTVPDDRDDAAIRGLVVNASPLQP